MNTNLFNKIFSESVDKYHVIDNVDQTLPQIFYTDSFERLLFQKNWIDTVQWHLEDIIRKPSIDPAEAVQIKRRIDKSNQDRTDMVEEIDDYFFEKFKDAKPQAFALLNTETPAWAIDRLSILALKIYHMREQTRRTDVDNAHILSCQNKLTILLRQQKDLSLAIDQLLDNLASGKVIVKTYKQMKMYNDPKLNPLLLDNSTKK
jgi:hypothetical protein